MKNVQSFLVVFAMIVLFFGPAKSGAQSITTGPLAVSALCAGDNINVTYRSHATFFLSNVFYVQLSDSNGSFDIPSSTMGAVTDTASSGTIVATVPYYLKSGSHYRVRVISSYPILYGSDNGTDLSLGITPSARFAVSRNRILEGDTVSFTNLSKGAVSYVWTFGDGASIVSSTSETPPAVSYSTPGAKYVSLSAISASGCSSITPIRTDSAVEVGSLIVASCNPKIPSDAKVDSVSEQLGAGSGPIWVQSGVTFISQFGSYDVYAEPGSRIRTTTSRNMKVYLKSGSLYFGGGLCTNLLIYESGATLDSLTKETLLKCSSLSFDYSDLPPNRFSVSVSPSQGISIYPNPASTMLYVQTAEAAKELSLINEAGEEVLHAQDGLTSKLQVNIENYPAGMYYLQLHFNDHSENRKVMIAR